MEIRRYTDIHEFNKATQPWLLEHEAENNLLLGLARRYLNVDHDFSEPLYLATCEVDGELQGCAFRSPPYKLGLTRFHPDALPALVDDLSEQFDALPAVMGRESEAAEFARLWCEKQGGSWAMGMQQGIYSTQLVTYVPDDVPGQLRPAHTGDRSTVIEWGRQFVEETGAEPYNMDERMLWLLGKGFMFVWEDEGKPRSMTAISAETPNGVRVGFVYTPPASRGRGYATVTVSMLSRYLLETKYKLCFLYTDLSNPTSNAIYERIGFEKVCEVVDINFGA